MSSLILSAIAVLLRITLAVPVSAATLPIGSSGACASVAGADVGGAGVAAGAAGVCGTGAGCTCASCVRSGAAFARPAGVRPATSRSANDDRRHIKEISELGGRNERRRVDFSLARLNAV